MKVVKCMICKKKCIGKEAGKHKDKTGHDEWEFIVKRRKTNAYTSREVNTKQFQGTD